MYTCANCSVVACTTEQKEQMPKNCPMRQQELMEEVLERYQAPEDHVFYLRSSEIEKMGYGEWPRLREVVEFAKCNGFTRLGLAFCMGLHSEARVVANLLRDKGFEVVSVICKTGGVSKERVGIAEEFKLHPGEYEAMCNPIGQAELLNREKTQFNIALGLCVGHDSLFYKYSTVPATCLVAKDRVLAHNPAGAIYCAEGYLKKRL